MIRVLVKNLKSKFMKGDTSKMFTRRKFIRNTSCFAGFIGLNSMSSGFTAAAETGDAKGKLHVKKEGGYFIIDSPFFAFCLNVTDGLKAMWWLNKLSNRKLTMGKGDEIRFTVGLPGEKIIIPRLKVDKAPGTGSQPLNEAVFELSGKEFKLTSETRLDKDVELIIKGHFVPKN